MRNNELPQTDPNGVFPISTTILLVSVDVGEKSVAATIGVLPISICTAIVSPIALAIAKIIAVSIPGRAAGTST